MSVDITMMNAKDVRIDLLAPGTEVGYDVLTEHGLSIETSEVLVIEGHPNLLRNIAQRALAKASPTDSRELAVRVNVARGRSTAITPVGREDYIDALESALDLALDLLGRQELR